MTPRRVYLTGGDVLSWQVAAEAVLGTRAVCTAAPAQAADLPDAVHAPDSLLSSLKALERQRSAVRRSDLIVAVLSDQYADTLITLGWADAMRIPMIVVCAPDSPHAHCLLVAQMADAVVATLPDALALAKASFL